MGKLTCFVVSPIGEKGSDIRKNSDDLLKLIIEPSLERFDFNIKRADKLTTVSSITNDIISHIQNSDLCVIDLTGQNSNVMYELGRRHESGKPFLLLSKEGETLPFDINTIRTIFYSSLSSPHEVRKTIKLVQSFVEAQVQDGFAPKSSGVSLTSISDSLARIERTLEGLKIKPIVGSESISLSDRVSVMLKNLSPSEAFKLCLHEGELDMAEELLKIIQPRMSTDNFFEYFIEPLAGRGSTKAYNVLLENMSYINSLSADRKYDILNNMVNYCNMHDTEADGLESLNELFTELESIEKDNNKKLALILNQKQRLLYGIHNYQEAINVELRVVELDPTNAYYYYNLSTNYYALKKIDDAAKYIDTCLNIDPANQHDADYLSKAIDIYRLKKDEARVSKLMNDLYEVNPYMHKLKQL